jgi:hypothetical protein
MVLCFAGNDPYVVLTAILCTAIVAISISLIIAIESFPYMHMHLLIKYAVCILEQIVAFVIFIYI